MADTAESSPPWAVAAAEELQALTKKYRASPASTPTSTSSPRHNLPPILPVQIESIPHRWDLVTKLLRDCPRAYLARERLHRLLRHLEFNPDSLWVRLALLAALLPAAVQRGDKNFIERAWSTLAEHRSALRRARTMAATTWVVGSGSASPAATVQPLSVVNDLQAVCLVIGRGQSYPKKSDHSSKADTGDGAGGGGETTRELNLPTACRLDYLGLAIELSDNGNTLGTALDHWRHTELDRLYAATLGKIDSTVEPSSFSTSTPLSESSFNAARLTSLPTVLDEINQLLSMDEPATPAHPPKSDSPSQLPDGLRPDLLDAFYRPLSQCLAQPPNPGPTLPYSGRFVAQENPPKHGAAGIKSQSMTVVDVLALLTQLVLDHPADPQAPPREAQRIFETTLRRKLLVQTRHLMLPQTLPLDFHQALFHLINLTPLTELLHYLRAYPTPVLASALSGAYLCALVIVARSPQLIESSRPEDPGSEGATPVDPVQLAAFLVRTPMEALFRLVETAVGPRLSANTPDVSSLPELWAEYQKFRVRATELQGQGINEAFQAIIAVDANRFSSDGEYQRDRVDEAIRTAHPANVRTCLQMSDQIGLDRTKRLLCLLQHTVLTAVPDIRHGELWIEFLAPLVQNEPQQVQTYLESEVYPQVKSMQGTTEPETMYGAWSNFYSVYQVTVAQQGLSNLSAMVGHRLAVIQVFSQHPLLRKVEWSQWLNAVALDRARSLEWPNEANANSENEPWSTVRELVYDSLDYTIETALASVSEHFVQVGCLSELGEKDAPISSASVKTLNESLLRRLAFWCLHRLWFGFLCQSSDGMPDYWIDLKTQSQPLLKRLKSADIAALARLIVTEEQAQLPPTQRSMVMETLQSTPAGSSSDWEAPAQYLDLIATMGHWRDPLSMVCIDKEQWLTRWANEFGQSYQFYTSLLTEMAQAGEPPYLIFKTALELDARGLTPTAGSPQVEGAPLTPLVNEVYNRPLLIPDGATDPEDWDIRLDLVLQPADLIGVNFGEPALDDEIVRHSTRTAELLRQLLSDDHLTSQSQLLLLSALRRFRSGNDSNTANDTTTTDKSGGDSGGGADMDEWRSIHLRTLVKAQWDMDISSAEAGKDAEANLAAFDRLWENTHDTDPEEKKGRGRWTTLLNILDTWSNTHAMVSGGDETDERPGRRVLADAWAHYWLTIIGHHIRANRFEYATTIWLLATSQYAWSEKVEAEFIQNLSSDAAADQPLVPIYFGLLAQHQTHIDQTESQLLTHTQLPDTPWWTPVLLVLASRGRLGDLLQQRQASPWLTRIIESLSRGLRTTSSIDFLHAQAATQRPLNSASSNREETNLGLPCELSQAADQFAFVALLAALKTTSHQRYFDRLVLDYLQTPSLLETGHLDTDAAYAHLRRSIQSHYLHSLWEFPVDETRRESWFQVTRPPFDLVKFLMIRTWGTPDGPVSPK
ncbi:hypothetical protein H4R33_002058 [Dimargaris cristalligena]|nr:hypothetical protein H4R33_002058 [Dimargaris cristalligena]